MVGAAQDAVGGRDRLVGTQQQDLLDQGGNVGAGAGSVGGGGQSAVEASQPPVGPAATDVWRQGRRPSLGPRNRAAR